MIKRFQSPLRELSRSIRDLAREHPAYSQVCEEVNVLCSCIDLKARVEEINRQEGEKE